MMRLFIELYLDEDVSVLVAEFLRARGFDVLTARDAGQLGRSDDEQLEYAVEHRRAFVTHNRADFEALAEHYFAKSKHHYGIIIAVRRPASEIARRLLLILDHVTSDEIAGQLVYI